MQGKTLSPLWLCWRVFPATSHGWDLPKCQEPQGGCTGKGVLPPFWALPPPHPPCAGSQEGPGDTGSVPSQLNAVIVVGVAVAVGLQGQQQ